ncbi:MarR family transcriptional regulator [Fertoebacter nigrum]|uniref:MarR family transcriptional regulator n=1 Tax=Fertoeibacter niger TaxID=2656921 RepID=A0A8X8H381_9RHOB|nr:MarR family transcriptional regulator [Fertoeibacter niger]NUB45494.1 MarR family transcriptional regulator [Fertoeibacter niger]
MTQPMHSMPAVDQVSDDTLRRLAGYNLKRAFNVIHADLGEVLAPLDLRMLTFSALTLIADNNGLTQTQLAEALAIKRPNLVVIVDELEGRGLILRNPVPNDRRAHALSATLPGRRLRDRALAAVLAHEARILAVLDPQERLALEQALIRIRGTA